jgi:hypothetical protein
MKSLQLGLVSFGVAGAVWVLHFSSLPRRSILLKSTPTVFLHYIKLSRMPWLCRQEPLILPRPLLSIFAGS